MAQLQYVNCQGKPLTVPPTQIDLRVRLAGLHAKLADARRLAVEDDFSDRYSLYSARFKAGLVADFEREIAEIEGLLS